ncbi:MAG: DUF192 domain-containing protein [archaeon]
MMKIKINNKIIFNKIIEKKNIGKIRGLMFSTKLDKKECVLFSFNKKKRRKIHTWFVFYPIDILFLNENNIIIEKVENLKPFKRYKTNTKFEKMIECRKGIIKEKNITKKDKIQKI